MGHSHPQTGDHEHPVAVGESGDNLEHDEEGDAHQKHRTVLHPAQEEHQRKGQYRDRPGVDGDYQTRGGFRYPEVLRYVREKTDRCELREVEEEYAAYQRD